jgi:hypothetical protein
MPHETSKIAPKTYLSKDTYDKLTISPSLGTYKKFTIKAPLATQLFTSIAVSTGQATTHQKTKSFSNFI